MAKKRTVKSKEEVRVLIKYNVPENTLSRYATNMTVQILGNEFKLAFFLSCHLRYN